MSMQSADRNTRPSSYIKEEQHKMMERYVLMQSLFLLPSVKPEMFRDENIMLESNMR